MEIEISICTYKNGSFDIIFIDPETGRELEFYGEKKFYSDEELELMNDIAPACTWTKYKRITTED